MQYLACRFGLMDQRRYTYHWDGEPCAVGDFVKVADARDSSAWKRVEVMAIVDHVPNFVTKPILGKADAPKDMSNGKE